MRSPSRAALHRERPPRRISEKKLAERKANGEQFVGSTIAKRGGRPKRKARPAKETRRIYGPVEYREHVHASPCLGCGFRGKPEQMQQAHVRTGGMSRKDDWQRTGPLCGPHYAPVVGGAWVPLVGCHHEQGNAKQSWRTHDGKTFAEAQAEFFAAWRAGRGGDGA